MAKLSQTIVNIEDCKQLIKSSGSVGSNYIEANESLSKIDFRYRIKICRKESMFWLRLLSGFNDDEKEQIELLINEAEEL